MVGVERVGSLPDGLSYLVFGAGFRLGAFEDVLCDVLGHADDAVDVPHEDVARSHFDAADAGGDAPLVESPARGASTGVR